MPAARKPRTSFTAILADQIAAALGDDAFTVAEICARIDEDADEDASPTKPNSLRTALRRGEKGHPPRFIVSGTGIGARWRVAR